MGLGGNIHTLRFLREGQGAEWKAAREFLLSFKAEVMQHAREQWAQRVQREAASNDGETDEVNDGQTDEVNTWYDGQEGEQGLSDWDFPFEG
jgi:hypothetical protein